MSSMENNDQNTSIPSTQSPDSSTSINQDVNATGELNKNVVDVIIAGAGIGGLVTALCLHRAGFSVIVREQAQELKPVGFGLSLQPYCVKLLYELGLAHELEEISIRPRNVMYHSRNGQLIFQDSRGTDAGYKWPVLSVHRSALQNLLLQRVRDEVGESSIRINQKLVAFRSLSTHVEVDFINPSNKQVTTEIGKVLIGADGINSTVRKTLYPDEGLPLWGGLNAWLGLAPVDQLFLDGRTVVCAGNPHDCFLIVYPMNSKLVSWNTVIRVADPEVRASSVPFDWNNLGHIEEILPRLTHMKLDCLNIHDLIKSSTVINQFPVTDRDILPRWTHDRVTLLGDAAHPMYPFGGNGASQAILDARALVLTFREHGVTPQGLQAYDDLRRLPSYNVTLSTRGYGVHKFLQVVDERLQTESDLVSDVVSKSEIQAIIDKCRQQAGLIAQQLNNEPSLF